MGTFRLACIPLLAAALAVSASAGDIRISIPKRTKPTAVQKLNQDGVKALDKHDYKRAKKLFYRAYLLDPDDPFTLNNLGYSAELEGQVERAERYYKLSQSQKSDAVVSKSTDRAALGQPVDKIAGTALDANMQINRMNVYALGLLQKDNAPQADLSLQKALKLDPNNAFTLNNLGFAREKEGELEDAYRYYTQAAQQHTDTPIMVTTHPSWRGKSISEVAAANARKVQVMMSREQDTSARVARLNTRGVAAINRNDYALARKYFQQAYDLDSQNAFAMNNMGYLAELDGDRETADYYYDKAREADQSSMKVAYATRKDVEGMKLASVAGVSDDAVLKATERDAELRRAQGGPVTLRYRNNQPVTEPATPPKPPEPVSSNTQPSGGLMQPLPENQQPAGAGQPGGLLQPLPENQQPPAAQSAPAQQQHYVPWPPASAPQQRQVPRPPQSQPGSSDVANPSNGLLMPLPDDQQPPAAQPQPTPQQ